MSDELNQIQQVVKSPDSYESVTYLWVIILSAWGGLVRVLHDLKKRPEDVKEALKTAAIGLITSVFVGIITFYLCEAAGLTSLTTAVCVAITGHAGADALKIMTEILKGKVTGSINNQPD